ncbi:hypothetical protein [Streptomyces sp. NPDC059258]|uniref:hypothetical protein n=1 Tax=unclassified Streptomyces TaxID=2593676 RepID=UPI003677AE44
MIQPGQTYQSASPSKSDPQQRHTRIKVVDELIGKPGVYGLNKVDIVTLTDSGREIRRRAIEVTQLHATATTRDGARRRTGYVLEGT